MRDHLSNGVVWRGLGMAVTMAAASALALAADPNYILEDVKIEGNQIHAFVDEGKQVTVILGDFQLRLGERTISARDAVLWIREHKLGRAVRHDITGYIEGDASVVQPDGTVSRDRVMLVTLHHQGRVSMVGAMSERPLKDFPLYKRAVAARRTPRPVPRAVRPVRPPTPKRIAEPPRRAIRPTREPQPLAPTATAPPRTETLPTEEKPKPVRPVTFRADVGGYQQRDDKRIFIARGNVYLSQGDPVSDVFLELRSQSAVVFLERRAAEKDTRSPFSPRIRGVATALPEAPEGEETVTGVYLEGDVVISRGERYLRGPSAYYDFTTDRAIVPNAVFRTIQKQRNIPIFIRAEECRALSARELWFLNARASTSDFYTPTYHIGARHAYLMDNTEYDAKGVRISEQKWHAKMTHTTFNIRGFPVLYAPYLVGDLTDANIPLRKAQFGQHGRFGVGVESEWSLFRLLGLVKPAGFKGRLELDWYERGVLGGVDLEYSRRLQNRQYSGYWMFYGLYDDKQKDEFGDERDNIPAPEWRGRILARHKEILPDDWRLQFELSYLCDRNFLEQYFPGEFYAGKEQETLIYAKKQRDNWAFTTLLQYRMNRFDTQTESVPDLGMHLIGEPLLGEMLTFYSESHAGFKRFRPAKGSGVNDSRIFARFDTRNELNLPLHIGPVNVVPYATARLTYWDDSLPDGEHFRPYGQVGAKADMHIWRVYDNVRSRAWGLNRLRHIITPEATGFVSGAGGVEPVDLFPMDPDIEQRLGELHGVSFGVHQRLQTKRGLPGNQHTVDWMRLAVVAGFYDGDLANLPPANGRFFSPRPEYSVPRDHLNFDYTWNISDATAVLADANLDLDSGDFRRANVGFAVSRDPRLRYYLGMRWIRDLDSAVGTFGCNYRINRKYSVSVFQQYDFAFRDGVNLSTSVNITRKFPRWYASLGFTYDQTQDDITLYISFWPEGIPEVKLGGGRISLLGKSDKN